MLKHRGLRSPILPMLTINNEPYLNLDQFLPLDSMPDVRQAIIESYDQIRFSYHGTALDINGESIVQYPVTSDRTQKEAWIREMRTGLCSPYAFLFLRNGSKSNNKHAPWIYDSIIDPEEIWDSFEWNSKQVWDPFIDWVETLPLKKIGSVYFFLQRPYVIPNHHQDHLMDKPYPHRQEFIRIGLDDKHFHILNPPDKPVKIDCKSVFFNQQNIHGSDRSSAEWGISFRIDCVFSDELRENLGIQHLEQY